MNKTMKALLVGLLIAAPNLANAVPTIFYEYSNRRTPPYVVIESISGVVDLDSIPNPKQLSCAPHLLVGVIESVEYHKTKDLPSGFRVRTSGGFAELIDLSALEKAELSMIDLTWLGKFFAPGRRVLVLGMRCGASGHEFVARDIYDASIVSKALAKSGRKK